MDNKKMRRISIRVFLMVVVTGLLSCSWIGTKGDSRSTIQSSSSNERDAVHIKAASYNIRYAAAADVETGNGWSMRKRPVAELIRAHALDVVGTQEGNFQQMDELLALLPEYDYIGYPYAGKTSRNHTASIVYKKAELEVVDHGTFWYSETPDVESIGWDATDTRICAWARMRHKASGQEFYFFTSHFYWRLETAKRNSGQVMVQKINEIVTDDLPIISTGDLNSGPNSPQIKDILESLRDAYHITETAPEGPESTNLGGGIFQGEPKGRIDYVLVNDKVDVKSYAVLTDTYADQRYPSDHLPVVCDLILKN